jgi:hypothetical protein
MITTKKTEYMKKYLVMDRNKYKRLPSQKLKNPKNVSNVKMDQNVSLAERIELPLFQRGKCGLRPAGGLVPCVSQTELLPLYYYRGANYFL